MIKKLLVLVLFLALVAGGVLLFAVYRSGDEPAPGASAAVGDDEAVSAARDRLETVVRRRSGSEVRLSEEDLQSLLVTALAEHPNGRRLLELSKSVSAAIEDGRVEVGVTVNLAEIPRESLSEEELEIARKIEATLPILADRDLYLGLDGVPRARDGSIAFDRDSRVHLAFLRLPIETVAEQFGFGDRFREELTFDLPYFQVDEVRVENDTLVLALSARERGH